MFEIIGYSKSAQPGERESMGACRQTRAGRREPAGTNRQIRPGGQTARRSKKRETMTKDTPSKKHVERTFVDARTGDTSDRPASEAKPTVDMAASRAQRKQNSLPFRLAAVGLWITGLALEIVSILCLNGTLYLPGPSQFTWFIIFLVIDFVAVVIGSQLWKRANHMNPPSKENKALYWLQTELGVLVAIVAFAPIVIILLLDKNADKRARTVGVAVAAVALVVAGASGVDYNPTSQEEYDQAVEAAALFGDESGTVFWTTYGRVYHLNPDCQAIQNSATIYSGSVDDAFAAKRSRACQFCAVEGGSDLLGTSSSEDSDQAATSTGSGDEEELDLAA